NDGERPHDDTVQDLDGWTAGRRDTPQRTRLDGGLRVVNVRAIRRLQGHVAAIVCHLDGISTGCRGLPDLIPAAPVRAEVDPRAVVGEARDEVVRGMRREPARFAACTGNYINLLLTLRIGVESNHPSVGRPSGRARGGGVNRSELDGVGPV